MTRYMAMMMLALLAGCGASDVATGDMSVPTQGGGPCVTDSDCPAGSRVDLGNGGFGVVAWVCSYKIADGCAAKGQCTQLPSPTCASFEELCGCDGQVVRSGPCFYASGYAGGPTTGAAAPACSDGGI